MSRLADNPNQRITAIDAMPGWLCVMAGLALLAMVVLTPAYLAGQTSQWRLNLMREQTQRLQRQMARYEQFEDALVTRDPAVIERLAFAELRLKPTNTEVLGTRASLLLGRQTKQVADHDNLSTPTAAYQPGAIPDWLNVTQPVVGLDYPRPPKNRSLLTRISTPPYRWLGLTAAFTIILIGILFTPDTGPDS